MFTDNDEVHYLQQRIIASLDMARAATDNCARMAHEALAERYGCKLAALKRLPHGRSSPVSPAFRRVEEMRLVPLLSTC